MSAVSVESNELQGLAAELSRLQPLKDDYVSDTRTMGFYAEEITEGDGVVVPRLTLDDVEGEFTINEHAQHQIAAKLEIPRRFWDRMRDDHPDIIQDTVRKLFVREPERRMVRTLEGVARAFVSNRYRRLDNYDLLEHSVLPALQEAGNDQMKVLQARTTDLRMYLKVLFPDVVFDDPRGGGAKLYGGIVIGNSEVGASSMFVDPFTWADYCLNGMTWGGGKFTDFGLRKMHIGRRIEDSNEARQMFTDETLKLEDQAFYAMAHDLILNSANGIRFKAIIEQIEKAAGIEVKGDVPQAVERLAKKYSLRDSEHESLMQHLIEGGNLSAWGFANAVTRTAQDASNYDRQIELERVGGELITLAAGEWKKLAEAA
jgi:hypothetical protein